MEYSIHEPADGILPVVWDDAGPATILVVVVVAVVQCALLHHHHLILACIINAKRLDDELSETAGGRCADWPRVPAMCAARQKDQQLQPVPLASC